MGIPTHKMTFLNFTFFIFLNPNTKLYYKLKKKSQHKKIILVDGPSEFPTPKSQQIIIYYKHTNPY